MKTQSFLSRYCKNLFTLALILFSLNGFSQLIHKPTANKTHLTTLQKVVDGIKQNNASIKNADSVNVMVNDKLVYNLQNVVIDPKSIALVEVLVLEPKYGSAKQINPSIIINTK